jgi:galactose-1-phosphate uridylyltransferase
MQEASIAINLSVPEPDPHAGKHDHFPVEDDTIGYVYCAICLRELPESP